MHNHEQLGKTATPGNPVGASAIGDAGGMAYDAGGMAYTNKLVAASERADAQAASEINETMDNLACNVVGSLLYSHLKCCRNSGKHGWYSYKMCSHSDLQSRLQDCLSNNDWLGVLAYATFLLMRQRLDID